VVLCQGGGSSGVEGKLEWEEEEEAAAPGRGFLPKKDREALGEGAGTLGKACCRKLGRFGAHFYPQSLSPNPNPNVSLGRITSTVTSDKCTQQNGPSNVR
jgi:hypothetical protein